MPKSQQPTRNVPIKDPATIDTWFYESLRRIS
jgi:hypothetical protein